MSAETLAVNRQQASRRRATAVFLGVCLFNFAGYGLIINCFGLFLSPVSVAQNISITEISLTHTVRTLCGMAGTVLAGRLVPRYDLRKYLALVCLGLAGAAVLTARSTVFWHFMLSAALLGFAAGLGIYTLVPLVISEWFTAPGGYIGLATACGGLGGIVFSPVLARVIQCRGWQAGYLLIAAVALLVMLPAGVFLIRFRPGELGLEPCTGKKTVRAGRRESVPLPMDAGVTPDQAAHMPVFYLIIGMFIAVSLVSGAYTHVPAMLRAKGYGEMAVGGLNACYQMGAALTQFLLGALSVRWGIRRTMELFLTIIGVGAVGLLLTGSGSVILTGVFALMLGGGRALGVVEGPILVREAFGHRCYNTIFSNLYTAYLTACALTTTIYGLIYDSTGSYTVVFLFILVCIVLAALTVFGSLFCIRRSVWRAAAAAQRHT